MGTFSGYGPTHGLPPLFETTNCYIMSQINGLEPVTQESPVVIYGGNIRGVSFPADYIENLMQAFHGI